MLAMLDDECLRPGHVDDVTFLNKLNSQCGAHVHYESRGCRENLSDKTIPHQAFRLVHYAGMVRITNEPTMLCSIYIKKYYSYKEIQVQYISLEVKDAKSKPLTFNVFRIV